MVITLRASPLAARPPRARPASDGRARAHRRLAVLARLMDNAFKLPGLGVRIGLDPLLGLVPGAGDVLTALISLYIVYEGVRFGATRGQVARMLANIAIDLVIGAVPILGDVFDIAFKANTRNLAILGIDPSRPRR